MHFVCVCVCRQRCPTCWFQLSDLIYSRSFSSSVSVRRNLVSIAAWPNAQPLAKCRGLVFFLFYYSERNRLPLYSQKLVGWEKEWCNQCAGVLPNCLPNGPAAVTLRGITSRTRGAGLICVDGVGRCVRRSAWWTTTGRNFPGRPPWQKCDLPELLLLVILFHPYFLLNKALRVPCT